MLHLEIIDVALVYCNIIWSITRYFTKKIIFLKTFNSEFSYTEVWLTDQNSKLLEIEVKINITLVIN